MHELGADSTSPPGGSPRTGGVLETITTIFVLGFGHLMILGFILIMTYYAKLYMIKQLGAQRTLQRERKTSTRGREYCGARRGDIPEVRIEYVAVAEGVPIQAETFETIQTDELVPFATHMLSSILAKQDTDTDRTVVEIDKQRIAHEKRIREGKALLARVEANLVALKAEAEPISRQVAEETARLEASRRILAEMDSPEKCQEDIRRLKDRIRLVESRITLLNDSIARVDVENTEIIEARDALKDELKQLQRKTAVKVAALDQEYATTVEANKVKLAAAKAKIAACVAQLEETRTRIAAAQEARDADLRKRKEKVDSTERRNEAARAHIRATRDKRLLVEAEIARYQDSIERLEERAPQLRRQIDGYRAYLELEPEEVVEAERLERGFSCIACNPESDSRSGQQWSSSASTSKDL
ncbi:hypothetical protein K474DRAFT_1758202 [Panus rudis PR-1116 ss-1]|nr:hypothetical protein K474DRAFT_1758202 [Panus rudis PR-1116 ss-1]